MTTAITKIMDTLKAELLTMGWKFENLKDGDSGVAFFSEKEASGNLNLKSCIYQISIPL
jgi:hypothetical protein